MTINEDTAKIEKIERLKKYFEKAKNDPQLLDRMGSDPIGVLQSMGITVEHEFENEVTWQLEKMKATGSPQSPMIEDELMVEKVQQLSKRPPAAPTNLRIVSDKNADAIPSEVLNALEFNVRAWGLVLIVREDAIKYVKGGTEITSIALATVGGASGILGLSMVLGPLSIVVGVVLAICAGAIAIYLPVIDMTDQGKGVYLTWTWAQLTPWIVPPLIPNPMYGLPVVTPIR